MITFNHNEATVLHSFLWTDLPFEICKQKLHMEKVYQLKSAVFLVSM